MIELIVNMLTSKEMVAIVAGIALAGAIKTMINIIPTIINFLSRLCDKKTAKKQEKDFTSWFPFLLLGLGCGVTGYICGRKRK